MSDTPYADQRLEQIRFTAGNMLDRLSQLLPADYKLTLIARHTKIANAQMVVTEETDIDLEKVANDLLTAKPRQ